MERFRIQLLVVGALILRDLRTRFGRSHLSYLFSLAMPVGHVLITAAVWIFMKRPVPIGDSALIFFSVTILPFVVWTYPQRQIALAILANKPLLYFPRVKIPDIMFSRAILETLTAAVGVCCVLATVAIAGQDIAPKNPFMFIASFLVALYFGVAVGMLNALVVAIWPAWGMGSALLAPLVWVSCGTFFMVEAVPSPYREWLAMNPVLQCVEWARDAYYWDYRSSVLDHWYPIWISTILIVFVLWIERFIRGRVLQG